MRVQIKAGAFPPSRHDAEVVDAKQCASAIGFPCERGTSLEECLYLALIWGKRARDSCPVASIRRASQGAWRMLVFLVAWRRASPQPYGQASIRHENGVLERAFALCSYIPRVFFWEYCHLGHVVRPSQQSQKSIQPPINTMRCNAMLFAHVPLPSMQSQYLCVPYTRPVSPASIESTVISTVTPLGWSTSTLCATHISLLAGPPWLLHRRHWLRTPGSPRAPAALNDAAEDGEEDETTNATGNADDKILVVVNPRTNLLGGGGALTLALEGLR